MRIAINALSAQEGGGVSVLKNILPVIAGLDRKDSYVIFYSPRQSGFIESIPSQFRTVIVRSPRNAYWRVLWEQCIFPWYLLQYRIDLLYSLGNTACILAPCRVLLLIENANPYSMIKLPWTLKDRMRLQLLRILGWISARRANKIRFVSENSKNLILPQLNIPTGRCVVIPHGVAMDRLQGKATHQTRPHDNPYLLAVGVNAVHRNVSRLLGAFSLLISRHGYAGDLVLVGALRSASYRAELERIITALHLQNRVIFVGETHHNQMGRYYQFADALVVASIEETFGIPLIEAMALGVPVAAADCDMDDQYQGRCFNPFRENCGDAASYFNPFDESDIANTLHNVLTDKQLRDAHVRMGREQAKRFSIDIVAQELVRLFHRTLDAPEQKAQ